VSMAAETSGTLRSMARVNRDAVCTSRGWTIEWRGLSNTSSKVSAASTRIRGSASDGAAGVRRVAFLPVPRVLAREPDGLDPLGDAAGPGRGRASRRDLLAIAKATASHCVRQRTRVTTAAVLCPYGGAARRGD
jgi:hypothetical protein